MTKQFTVITKDGSKWLRPINPHPEKLSTHGTPEAFYYNPEWQEFEKNNFDLPYIGYRPEGTVLSEEAVREVWQSKHGSVWSTISGDHLAAIKALGIKTRAAYTDADPPDIDYEKEMPHKEWPSTKYTARKVDAESHDRHISDDYWRKRCEAAEKYINESPCDPDITPDQEAAYEAWQEIVKQEPK